MTTQPQPPPDYRALSDDELNRLIAERRGWTNLQGSQSRPQATLFGIPPGGTLSHIGHWSTDNNALIELMSEIDGAVLTVNLEYDARHGTPFVAILPGVFHDFTAYGDTACHAFCYTWLMRDDAQKAAQS